MDLLGRVKKGDVVIDCGAYVGKMTHYFADKGAKVYALEPSPFLCNRLEQRFKYYQNVSVVRAGAYDKDCKLRFYYHKEYTKVARARKVKYMESSSVYSKKRNVGKKFFVADVIDLAELIKQLDCDIKVLKLNVEGSEYRILNRLIETGVIHRIKCVVVAFHNKSIPSLERDHSELKARAIKAGVYGSIIKWKWWRNNSKVLSKIRKDWSL